MSGFSIKNFAGVIPRVASRLLPNSAAQIASNCKLYSGELRSWLSTTAINTPSKGGSIKSAYRIYSTGTIATTTATEAWLAWPDDVDVVRGPIAGDTAFKLYFTGDTTTATNAAAGPRKTNLALATTGGTDFPHDWLEMGVPAPSSAPTVIGTGGTSTVSETRVYLYTYVTNTASWSEEGPPSATGTGTGKSDAGWVIAALSTGTTGKYAFDGGIKRIYRTLTGNDGNTNYQLALDNVPMATTSTSDTTTDANLGMICPSFELGIINSEFVAPPADMKGLIALPNGIMAGFSGNQLCFSEPYLPYAWPIRYRLTMNYPIVSLGAYGQTLICTTKGFPVAVTGIRPDAMAQSQIEDNYPCVSKRSTVSFPYGVMWATPEGLVLAGVGGVANVTNDFMKRIEYEHDSWQSLCFPDTLIGHRYMNAYFGFFTNSDGNGNSFIFDKTNPEAPLTFGNLSVQGVWNDPETGKLYLIQSGTINEWDARTERPLSFDWKSKTFVFPRPVNFSAIQVDAEYFHLNDVSASDQQVIDDAADNALILGTGAADTRLLTAWVGTTVYTTGDVRKSVDGVKQIICTVGGTSSSTEPTYSGTIGGTSTDGAVRWKRIWELDGVTKGSLRGAITRGYIQRTSTDPFVDGTAGNQWGFPLRGSLMVGGTYTGASIEPRALLLQVYATIDNSTTATGESTVLVNSQYLTSRAPVRLPKGFSSDTWEIRLSGNIPVRFFKIAETMEELGQIT